MATFLIGDEMKAEVKIADSTEPVGISIECDSYFVLIVTAVKLWRQFAERSRVEATIIFTAALVKGDLKVTDAGRAQWWRWIAVSLFLEKLIGYYLRTHQ